MRGMIKKFNEYWNHQIYCIKFVYYKATVSSAGTMLFWRSEKISQPLKLLLCCMIRKDLKVQKINEYKKLCMFKHLTKSLRQCLKINLHTKVVFFFWNHPISPWALTHGVVLFSFFNLIFAYRIIFVSTPVQSLSAVSVRYRVNHGRNLSLMNTWL